MRHPSHEAPTDPQWKRAKEFKQLYGISPAQLKRYSDAKLIRTSHIRRPGQTRGIRLFSLTDIDRLIAEGEPPDPVL